MKTFATLAERFRDPKNDYAMFGGKADNDPIRPYMLRAQRFVMDDAAIKLATQLSDQGPREIARMLDSIVLPGPHLWIEFGAEAMLSARGGLKRTTRRPPDARVGMLIGTHADHHMDGQVQVWALEDTDPDIADGKVWGWPMSFWIAIDGSRPFEQTDEGALATWGYFGERLRSSISPLKGRATPTADETYLRLLKNRDDAIDVVMKELSGWARLTVAVLSVLSTVVEIGEETREPGRRLLSGLSRPYLSTRPLTLAVPRRIRNVVGYARRAINAAAHARKRLHEVSAHYRHLTHEPRAPGWQSVEIAGVTYWRKRIDRHLRGDPALGVVEHGETIVRGPSEICTNAHMEPA